MIRLLVNSKPPTERFRKVQMGFSTPLQACAFLQGFYQVCERSNIEELEPRWKLNSEIPPSLWHEMTGFTCWAKKLINKNVINRDRGRDRLSHFSLSAKYFEAIDYSPADLHSMLQIENKIGLSNFREMENWSKRFFGRGG
ncbi:hypothetical protein RUM44_002955 [Polyplax serrata]|uniref:LAGLIDADG homing endonuclease n=1 Tax=Polyplax serrata TaxID=468196 RepID=A0ABR1AX88_POLSC